MTKAANAPQNLTPLESIMKGTQGPAGAEAEQGPLPAEGASSAGHGEKGAADANKVG